MKLNQLLLLGALALSLAACGGSSGSGGNTPPPPAGAQPTALTAAGMVTGFGSIYVNGIEFETNSASYDLDDTAGSSDSDLSVGMFVVVQGTVNADGVTGTADSVSYDDEVEGPVEDLMTDAADPTIKTFTVLHTDIVISSSTVFDAEDGSAFGFDTIMNGDNVEVSGEYVGDVLHATYVELQDAGDDEYEAKGTISGFNGTDMFTLTLDNGSECARFDYIETITGMKVFFADPYAAWQRGAIENTNGLLRQYYPKGTDFRRVTEKALQKVVKRLNHRPRKCLGYRTPHEVFMEAQAVALAN